MCDGLLKCRLGFVVTAHLNSAVFVELATRVQLADCACVSFCEVFVRPCVTEEDDGSHAHSRVSSVNPVLFSRVCWLAPVCESVT